MKRCQRVLPALLMVTAALLVLSQISRGEEEDPVKPFMRAKLQHSQLALEGLTTGDFDAIAKSANQMKLLSLEAAWQVLQTPEYTQQSLEFRRATDALATAAKDKNLDGAALAYVDITMKCVQCHKYVRSVRSAELPEDRILR